MDKYTLAMLGIFKERGHLTLMQLGAILNVDAITLSNQILYLLEQGYIQKKEYPWSNDEGLTLSCVLQITYKGLSALDIEKTSRLHFKYNKIRAWGTLAIALISLVLSIINFTRAL